MLKLARFMASEKFVPFAWLFMLGLIMSATSFMTFFRGRIIAFAVFSLFFTGIAWHRKTLQS